MVPQQYNQKFGKHIKLKYTEHFYVSLALKIQYISLFKFQNDCIYLNTRTTKFPILFHKLVIHILCKLDKLCKYCLFRLEQFSE